MENNEVLFSTRSLLLTNMAKSVRQYPDKNWLHSIQYIRQKLNRTGYKVISAKTISESDSHIIELTPCTPVLDTIE